jgi:hypothetical protein
MGDDITAFEKCERIGYSFFVDWRNIDEVVDESMFLLPREDGSINAFVIHEYPPFRL